MAARSIKGQLQWLLSEEKMLAAYKDAWLADQAAEELDYRIFFAVSEKSGKDNRGAPIWRKENGERMLDSHGHLIVDHDLDEIANTFVEFAKEQEFYFWNEA